MLDQEQFYSELGERITTLRKKVCLSQDELATSVALSRTSVTNIERGKQKVSLYTCLQIARKLRVEFEELIPQIGEFSLHDLEKLLINLPREQQDFVRSGLISPIIHSQQ